MGAKLVGIVSRGCCWESHVPSKGDEIMHFLSRRTAGQVHADSKANTLGVARATWTFLALLLLLAAQLFSASRVLGDSTGEQSPTATAGGFTNGAYASLAMRAQRY